MKVFFAILIYLALSNNDPLFIEGKNYKGYIFPKDYKNEYYVDEISTPFTPSKHDVIIAEAILKKGIKDINKNRINQGGDCPYIDKKLCKYNRQYFGKIDKNGHKILFINFIWMKSTPEYWNKEIVKLYDGCSHYWNVKIDLEHKKLFDLKINGKG